MLKQNPDAAKRLGAISGHLKGITVGVAGNRDEGIQPVSEICGLGLAYWNRLRGTSSLPNVSQFDPLDIVKLLPHVVFLEVIDGGTDFRYRVIGEHVLEFFSANYTGMLMSENPRIEPEGHLITRLRRSVDLRRPIHDPVEYIGPHRDFKKNDDIILPFADDDGQVKRLLVFVEFINKA